MYEKIFWEISSAEELNELANNLRNTKEFDEIRLLCKENNISEDVIEEFIKGNRLTLVTKGYLESRKALQSRTWKAARESIKKKKCNQEVKAESGEKAIEHTLEDVRKKLESELEIYRDGDSKYVVEKLIKLCETDSILFSAVLLPYKSYDKAFQYFYEKSRTVGYKMPHGNMVYLDNDKAVELSVEYFKRDETEQEIQKATKKEEQPRSEPNNKLVLKDQEKKPENFKHRTKVAEQKKAKLMKELHRDKNQIQNEMSGQLSLFDYLGSVL